MHDQPTLQDAFGIPVWNALSRREDDGPVLRFGFTYGHVEALARRAIRDHFASCWRDREDRYEAAWGAAVERLYSAEEPVSALDLLRAGSRGLDRLARVSSRDRGRNDSGTRVAPGFWRYWTSPDLTSPEEETVELAALEQIMTRLTPAQAETLHVLAEHGNREAAAGALGVGLKTFDSRLGRARSAFLVLWHEHEAPSRKWKDDKRYFRRGLRGQSVGGAEAARVLAAIAEAFGGRKRGPTRDLLAALAAADPTLFGDWDSYDLACFLRRHEVPSHWVVTDDRRLDNGARRILKGYWLEQVIAALDRLTTGTGPAAQQAAAA